MFLARNPETLELEPSIIQSWEAVDENTWRLEMVEGAMFHDGTPVDADAAVFTFERAAKDKVGDKPRVQSIANQIGFVSATAVDAKTIEIKTDKPAAIFPALLTSFEIVPPSYFSDESPEN